MWQDDREAGQDGIEAYTPSAHVALGKSGPSRSAATRARATRLPQLVFTTRTPPIIPEPTRGQWSRSIDYRHGDHNPLRFSAQSTSQSAMPILEPAPSIEHMGPDLTKRRRKNVRVIPELRREDSYYQRSEETIQRTEEPYQQNEPGYRPASQQDCDRQDIDDQLTEAELQQALQLGGDGPEIRDPGPPIGTIQDQQDNQDDFPSVPSHPAGREDNNKVTNAAPKGGFDDALRALNGMGFTDYLMKIMHRAPEAEQRSAPSMRQAKLQERVRRVQQRRQPPSHPAIEQERLEEIEPEDPIQNQQQDTTQSHKIRKNAFSSTPTRIGLGRARSMGVMPSQQRIKALGDRYERQSIEALTIRAFGWRTRTDVVQLTRTPRKAREIRCQMLNLALY